MSCRSQLTGPVAQLGSWVITWKKSQESKLSLLTLIQPGSVEDINNHAMSNEDILIPPLVQCEISVTVCTLIYHSLQ